LYTLCTGALTITYFIPTLVGALGYTGSTIQYMTVPIYATCIILVLIVCNHSDYRRDRAWHLVFCGLLSAVSFAIIMGVQNRIAQYVFLCFAAAGIWSAIPLILVWVSNVITWPGEKRAIAQAATNAAGNCASVRYNDTAARGRRASLTCRSTAPFCGQAETRRDIIPDSGPHCESHYTG
jgi:hypothetical protein